VDRHQGPSEVLTGTLLERWGTVESKLGGLLASVSTTPDFESKIRGLSQSIQQLMNRDSTASQFLLFNRAITQFNGYSVSHSLLCAALAQSLVGIFELKSAEGDSLVCAALTMNVAMTRLQDQLALQKDPLTTAQRNAIDAHGRAGKVALVRAGVTDTLWLELVEQHHSPVSGPDLLSDWPLKGRLIKILQTVDRYTAAMSPRKSRVGRTAKDSVHSVVVQAGGPKLDQVGTALVRILGVSPPGTYVKLANGETAVVMRRGAKPTEPIVASVINRNDEPIAEPRLHDTSKPALAVQATLIASSIRLSLNMDAILKLIPK
jgi:HD-GYP domain-containing protein (c-di-GMP phosphodiesterase class II)